MNRFVKQVRVIANPYFTLDHKARPAGIFPYEPNSLGAHLGYVGASVDTTATTILREDSSKESEVTGDLRGARQDTVYKFSSEAITVPSKPHYLEGLRCGALLPADKDSADIAGLTFVPPADALKAAKEAAERAFDDLYGEGSVAYLQGATSTETATEKPSTSKKSSSKTPEESAS